jgi:hypothetical protein
MLRPLATPPPSYGWVPLEQNNAGMRDCKNHYADSVFPQTMDQFKSFKKFIDKVDKYGMKSGIVKVIPPKEWYVDRQLLHRSSH